MRRNFVSFQPVQIVYEDPFEVLIRTTTIKAAAATPWKFPGQDEDERSTKVEITERGTAHERLPFDN